MACYDTGTYGNHISLALATAMGYELDHSFQDSFKLPNGNHLRSIGRITAKIRFLHKTYTHDETDVISCHFNVYDRLAIPLLLGMTFLHGTETLSKHRYRLKTIADYNLCLHRICSIGAATNRISCMINGRLVNSQADTGSDIALVDSQYVKTHGLELLPGCEKLMFADGSVGYTQGCVDVILTLPTAYDKGRTPWQKVRFHVLENCSFDFIFDETLVEDYGIFQETCKSLEICTGVDADVIAPIIHLGPVENVFAKASDKIKAMLKPQRPATVGESAKAEQNGKYLTCSQL
ncbi:hypothetical protein B0T12DRAFT_394911 [Alternaria alternata]|nr:hypothetical protein B0T12DRAFT_394911 [Alternaria alternata]